MSLQGQELKQRIASKRKQVEARIHELKADGTEESRQKAEALREKLNDVSNHVRDGYENLKEGTIAKLNEWLKQ